MDRLLWIVLRRLFERA